MILRMSTLFVRTLRDDPVDAEVPSHRLLVRAGYVRRAAPGIYTWLPLGLRVLRNVETIIREEMDAIGAQELQFPALLPREPYEASGRWTEYGDGIFRLKDRKGGDYLLGPTHEEMFTLAVKDLYSSYKDLPVWLYQIQTKYRDEARPRAGILRGREFIMKDSYSFDTTDAGLDASYAAHRDAYVRTFDRLGFDYVIVKATSGAMGGSKSEEFLARAEVGEDTYVRCSNCDYAANVEAVQVRPPAPRRVRRRARGARRADARHPDHRDPGRAPQREAPPRRPALDSRRHPEERARRAQARRRHPRAARDRPARRPRGRPEAARGPARADRGRADGRGRDAQAPDPREGLHRARHAGGAGHVRYPLRGRPPDLRGHRLGDRRQRRREPRARPRGRPRLHARRHHRGGRGPRRRPLPELRVRHPPHRARHRDGPHLPARAQVRRGARPARARRERQAGHRHHGLLRHRRLACGRRHRGGQQRRAGPGLAPRDLARRRARRGHRQGRGRVLDRGRAGARAVRPPGSTCSTTTGRRSAPA